MYKTDDLQMQLLIKRGKLFLFVNILLYKGFGLSMGGVRDK